MSWRSRPTRQVAIDFLKSVWASDIDFYQKILVDQGAVGTLLAARGGSAYQLKDPFFGGEQVWQDFADWIGKIPGIDYGTYTAEVDFCGGGPTADDRPGRFGR